MKLKRSPLILVLAQIRFAPVLGMGRMIEQIQGSLRKNGFPLFEEEQVQEFNLNVGNAQPEVRSKRRWIFTDLHKHRSIVMTDSFIAFETSRYDAFAAFSKQIQEILLLVSGVVELSAVERIGLRYVDLIREIDGKHAYELVHPGLRGFCAGDISTDGTVQSMTISQMNTSLGRLIVRAVLTNDGSTLPPDLAATKLEIDSHVNRGEEVAILDFDHFSNETASFKIEDVMATLSTLHSATDIAFKQSVTPEAIALWK